MLFWSMFIILYEYIDILVATLWERSIQYFWAAQPPLFIKVFLSLTTWHFQKSGRLFKWRVVTTSSDRHDLSRYLKLPQKVRLPAVKLTSFLNFTTRHPVSRAVNSNWRPDSVHVNLIEQVFYDDVHLNNKIGTKKLVTNIKYHLGLRGRNLESFPRNRRGFSRVRNGPQREQPYNERRTCMRGPVGTLRVKLRYFSDLH